MKAGQAVALDPSVRSPEVKDFESELRKRIIGQDQAVECLVDTYQTLQAGLNQPGRPVGNVLFLGPTGTGKTRTIEATAEVLFGDPKVCIKIDCGEFQHSHEIAKLVGSPPGYLGHRETHAMLTQEALNQCHTDKLKLTLLLFDEIEKASDALWNLMLGILDKASLTLGDNRRVDLSRCLIAMTSNLGASQMQELISGGMGFHQPKVKTKNAQQIEDIAINACKRKFSPEFMNRIDKSVVFQTLEYHHFEQILEIELGQLQNRLTASLKPFYLDVTPKAKEQLLKSSLTEGIKYGARNLKREIEKNLTKPLAAMVGAGIIKMGNLIEVYYSDGFQFVKETF